MFFLHTHRAIQLFTALGYRIHFTMLQYYHILSKHSKVNSPLFADVFIPVCLTTKTLCSFFFFFTRSAVANLDLKGPKRWRTISSVAPNHSLRGRRSCVDQREAVLLNPHSWDILVSLYQPHGPIMDMGLQPRSGKQLAL